MGEYYCSEKTMKIIPPFCVVTPLFGLRLCFGVDFFYYYGITKSNPSLSIQYNACAKAGISAYAAIDFWIGQAGLAVDGSLVDMCFKMNGGIQIMPKVNVCLRGDINSNGLSLRQYFWYRHFSCRCGWFYCRCGMSGRKIMGSPSTTTYGRTRANVFRVGC